jgi:hypothetical protein
MLAGNPQYSDMELIATSFGAGGTQGGISFASIPQGYKHLQLRITGRPVSAGYAGTMYLYMNNDGGANYNSHLLKGNGSAVSSAAFTSGNGIVAYGLNVESSTTAGSYSTSIIDVLDYTSTSKNKTARWFTGYTGSASNQVALVSGAWRSTAAVTDMYVAWDGYVATGSRFSLYGIKG